MIAFGPVPSRRLGRSLGINNIPAKFCSYSCVYCQVGRTCKQQIERRSFFQPEEVLGAVRAKVEGSRDVGEHVGFLTYVPSGEPTLDIHLGQEIKLLQELGIPIAVISNASLIWRQDVRDDLMDADWVSLKVDAVSEAIWRRINRPHKSLDLDRILADSAEFRKSFAGELVTETMLVAGVNDDEEHLEMLSAYLAHLQPDMAYLSVSIRPPAEAWVRTPEEASLNRAYQKLAAKVDRVEILTGYEGDSFASTDNVEEDLLSITAVHPMRRDAIAGFLSRAGAGWQVVDRLVAGNRLVATEYRGHRYYISKLEPHQG